MRAALAVALIGLAACEAEQPAEQARTPPPSPPAETPSGIPRAELEPVSFTALPGWPDPQLAEAVPAFRRSCAILLERPDDQPLGPPQAGRISDWRPICAELDTIGDQAAFREFLERSFIPYIVHDRGEPDIGEINYPYVLHALQNAGYSGFIGAEYKPRGRSVEDGLSWIREYR